jgi:hypothetical protein
VGTRRGKGPDPGVKTLPTYFFFDGREQVAPEIHSNRPMVEERNQPLNNKFSTNICTAVENIKPATDLTQRYRFGKQECQDLIVSLFSTTERKGSIRGCAHSTKKKRDLFNLSDPQNFP